MEQRINRRKTRKGTVVSDKMDKTVVVSVERRMPHPRYRKVVTIKKNVKAHNEKNDVHDGDFVEIMETRRLSKDKRWRVTKVIRKSKSIVPKVVAEEQKEIEG